MNEGEEVVNQRESTHGNFHDTAAVAYAFECVLNNSPNVDRMSPQQRYAAQMILAKMARIACGDPNYPDHWKDIAGFATLILRELEGK